MGESTFKIKAYDRAATSVFRLDEDIEQLYRQDRLYDIPGVGKSIKTIIEEILQTGSSSYLEELFQLIPPGVLHMLKIPGLGHRSVRQIYQELGVQNLDELEVAAQLQRIRTLPGMGAKTEQNILEGIASLREHKDRIILGAARPEALALLQEIQGLEDVLYAEITGSIRRGKSLVGDIDILVAAENEALIKRKLKILPRVYSIEKDSPGCLAGRLNSGHPFEVIMVSPADYYHSLVWTTGSKAHRSKLFTGIDRGSLQDLGSEAELYQDLGLDYIPPELREDQGEFEAARGGTLPHLLKREDIQGDLHLHTLWSDGSYDIYAMVEKARQLGYRYIAISEHSKSLTISNGLDEERLRAQGKLIDQINQEIEDIQVLKAIEVDVLKDGQLDLDDEVLKDLDLVIAAIHSHFRLGKEEQTRRIIKAMQNEHVHVFAHLSGRLLNRRSAYEFDLEKVLAAAAEHNVALEINANPDRLDVDENIARQAKSLGIRMVINSDAHHIVAMEYMDYGVLTARRGWLEPEDVLNTLPLDELKQVLKNK